MQNSIYVIFFLLVPKPIINALLFLLHAESQTYSR